MFMYNIVYVDSLKNVKRREAHVITPYTYIYNTKRSYMYIVCRGFESHPRQLIFSRKSDCLGCAVLLCLVCLFVWACLLLSFISH